MSRPHHHGHARPRTGVCWAWWLLIALWCTAQALALEHRIAHGAALHAGVPAAAAPAPLFGVHPPLLAVQAHHHGEHCEHTQPADPHGHDAGSAECRLVDQVGHADALLAEPALPGPPAARVQPPTARVAAGPQAAPARPYEARAPPQAG
jgi:hypothetical protein